jgi:hypothetical protein
MYWIRRHRRFGSWAALFALTVQLVLSFGHIHLENYQAASPVVAAALQVQPASPTDEDGGPAGHRDFCAICAALNLTSSSVLPTIALPVSPDDQPYKWLAYLRPAQFSRSVHFLFQPRAPPYSV